MKPFIDGATSILAAIVTLIVCGGPVWLSHLAIRAELAPLWAYTAVAGLAFVGVIMTFAFLRKGLNGISPARERRR